MNGPYVSDVYCAGVNILSMVISGPCLVIKNPLCKHGLNVVNT